MRIAVVAAPNQGKTKFIEDFLKTWPNYKLADGIKTPVMANNLPISTSATKETQDTIMNQTIDEMCLHSKGSHVIHDNNILDNLVKTLWLSDRPDSEIDEKFVEKTIKLAHVTLTFLDLVIFLPKLEKYYTSENSDQNELDNIYADEINNLFLAVQDTYNKSNNTIFPFESVEGSPAMVEIFGRPEERIQMMKLYLDTDGEPYGKNPKDSLITLPNIEEQTYIDKLIDQTSTKPKKPRKLKN
jgi:hypothetical protein